MSDDVQSIRILNDLFRKGLANGRMMMTRGVAERPAEQVREIMQRVVQFDSFSDANDPYHEHDYGSFDFGSDRILWKIDYYDAELKYGSEDPADPAKTTRVLTVMLAEEY